MIDLVKHHYRLRWKFVFNNNKATKCGMWNAQDNEPKNAAWCVNKEYLSRAIVEYEDISTYKTGYFADCPGHDFVNFEWIAVVPMSTASSGTERFEPTIVGLTLVTRELKVHVYTDGSHRVEVRSIEEQLVQLAGFGK